MKTVLSIAALFLFVISANAQENVYRSELPSKVRSFLASNFKSPFNHAVRLTDDDTESTSYSIILNNNTEIKFAEDGKWKTIDGKGNTVPYSYLEKPIVEYLKTNHGKNCVTRVEICDSECRLALNNGQALKFDSKGNVVSNN